jgi:toxin secretion/phage lysis holin
MQNQVKNIFLSVVTGNAPELAARFSLAALGAGLAAYFGAVAVPVLVLVGVMIADYGTGMLKAWKTNEFSSKAGIVGIVKKVCYLLLMCVGGVVDWLLTTGLAQIGIDFKLGFTFGVLLAVWLIIVELISILENLAVIGVPVPHFLATLISKLKNAVEARNEETDHE